MPAGSSTDRARAAIDSQCRSVGGIGDFGSDSATRSSGDRGSRDTNAAGSSAIDRDSVIGSDDSSADAIDGDCAGCAEVRKRADCVAARRTEGCWYICIPDIDGEVIDMREDIACNRSSRVYGNTVEGAS